VQDVRLVAPAVRVRRPARVRLTVDGRRLSPVDVAPDGSVRLPAPVRGRDFRLDVLDARFPAGTPSAVRQRRAVGIAEVRGAGVPTQSVPRTGAVTLPCGVARIVAGGTTVALRATAARAAVDAGSPVRLHACGPLRLPAGEAQVTGSTAPVRVDGVRLSSPAARPAAVTGGGRVVDDGREQHGDRDGVRVDVAGPSWLVLGQSYDMQWRASCDGRDLGAPEPVEGYANGWPVDRGCRDVRFTYAPQRLADIAGAISLVGAAGLLALLAMVALRRRGLRDTPAEPLALADPPRARPLAPRHAVAVALPVAVVVAAVFGLRAGIVAAPAVFVILWRGVSDRVLALLAAALLGVAVPLVYLVVALLVSEDRLGGNSTQYGADRLAAHWLAVGAVVALAIVLWRTLAAVARRQRVPIASRR
jgi:arabinofuranan 3-O-arabinosyltransferase